MTAPADTTTSNGQGGPRTPAAVGELDARLARLESSYEALEEALALPSPTTNSSTAPAPSTEVEPEPLYPNVEAWVAGWFAPTFARRLGTVRWCATWWAQADSIFRLEALWRSWEALRLDPVLGMATWLRDHLDPQRAVLMGDGGPFQACEDAEHNQDAAAVLRAPNQVVLRRVNRLVHRPVDHEHIIAARYDKNSRGSHPGAEPSPTAEAVGLRLRFRSDESE